MDTQVHITLTSLNGEIYPAERDLLLRRDLPPVHIGRSSKNVHKERIGRSENAWFDSPVMSRDHAEFALDPVDNIVTIRDIGSMHGTFFNNAQLKAKERWVVNDNDVVVFGTRIARGSETILPCAFRINVEVSSYNPKDQSSTFAFPDSSEIEDDVDFGDSDDDRSYPSSINDANSIESPVQDAPRVVEAISPAVDNATTTHPWTRKRQPELASAETIDSVEEDLDSHHSFLQYSPEPEPDLYSLDEPISSEGNDPRAHTSPLTELSDRRSQSVPRTGSFEPSECSDENSRLSLTEGGGGVEVAESVRAEYSESELSLSDAGREGIHALFRSASSENGNEITHFENEAEPDDRKDTMSIQLDDYVTTASRTRAQETLEHTTIERESSEEALKFPEFHTKESIMYNHLEGLLQDREPSPSDAAMVKSAVARPENQDQTSTPVPVDHILSAPWRRLTTETMREKSPNRTFLEAREANKMALNSVKLAPLTPSNGARCQLPGTHELMSTNFGKTFTVTPESDATFASLFLSGSSFKSKVPATHSESGKETAQSSPPRSDFDDLESEDIDPNLSIPQYQVDNSSEPFDVENRSTDDIRGNSPIRQPHQNKRKADAISNIIEDEVRIWAASKLVDLEKETSPPGGPQTQGEANANITPTETALQPEPSRSEAPSGKRLKKMVEGAAYIAIGGLGLFSILVATAPDFL